MVETVQILGRDHQKYASILTEDAFQFLVALHQQFESRREELLELRKIREVELSQGKQPDFLKETAHVREGDWTCNSTPVDLMDRRVEITGPVDRKMVINALNAGVRVFMADFEDSSSPTWSNMMDGQVNLFDAVRKTISYQHPKTGKQYQLKEKVATLMVRPRGWHLVDSHISIGGRPISASLLDFGLFFFHNARYLLDHGSGPYFYLPKLESHLEARLWNDVFVFAQTYVGIPVGSIRATVLIETILAAFEMDEILYELRDHSAGLNCGRWDYIFSFIKKFRHRPDLVLPDRNQVGMDRPFMDAYVRLLIKTCHRRKVHAMGGMAAQIPIKNDEKANSVAMQKVAEDKLREVQAGHDGTWVAHPALVPIAMDIFNKHMPKPNQIDKKRLDVHVSAADLMNIGQSGFASREGLTLNIDVGLKYLEAWLRGVGCVPIHNKMEDAATAEISRSQVWQWLRHHIVLSDGTEVSAQLISDILNDVVHEIKGSGQVHELTKIDAAANLYKRMLLSNDLADFLTVEAYPQIVDSKGIKSSL